MPYYAVVNGRTNGIFQYWADCNKSVKNLKNALYKKFDTKEEAKQFIASNIKRTNDADKSNSPKLTKPTKHIPDYYVYTDGATSNNGAANAVAGIGIFFGIEDSRNVSQKVNGKQTNNVAELTAILRAYNIIENDIINGKKITIVSDSTYAIKCATSYGKKCYLKNYKTTKGIDVPNKTLVKTAYEMFKDQPNIQFLHIKAHTRFNDIHSIGNENADKLANQAIEPDKGNLIDAQPLTDIAPRITKTNHVAIENDIKEMKDDIKEIKNTIKQLTLMVSAVYDFEDE